MFIFIVLLIFSTRCCIYQELESTIDKEITAEIQSKIKEIDNVLNNLKGDGEMINKIKEWKQSMVSYVDDLVIKTKKDKWCCITFSRWEFDILQGVRHYQCSCPYKDKKHCKKWYFELECALEDNEILRKLLMSDNKCERDENDEIKLEKEVY